MSLHRSITPGLTEIVAEIAKNNSLDKFDEHGLFCGQIQGMRPMAEDELSKIVEWVKENMEQTNRRFENIPSILVDSLNEMNADKAAGIPPPDMESLVAKNHYIRKEIFTIRSAAKVMLPISKKMFQMENLQAKGRDTPLETALKTAFGSTEMPASKSSIEAMIIGLYH